MHIVAGGLVVALLGVGTFLVYSRLTGKPVTAKALVAVAAAGFVAGVVSAATLGAGGAASAGLVKATAVSSLSGAAGRTTFQATTNLQEGQPLQDGLLEASAMGAAQGAVTGVVGATITPLAKSSATGISARALRGSHAGPRATRLSGAILHSTFESGANLSAGAAGGAARRVVGNALEKRPWSEGVPEAARASGGRAVVSGVLGVAKGTLSRSFMRHGGATEAVEVQPSRGEPPEPAPPPPSRGLTGALGGH
jgi:hypothetical protein